MQYPLGEHEREQIASKTGKKLDEITLDAVMRNQIAPDDIKISKEMLYAQGQVAKENGNDPMEKNFERAAELVDNGIQCDIPAEQCTGDQQHNDISDQDIIPGIYAFLLGQIDTDEIRTACCCTDI